MGVPWPPGVSQQVDSNGTTGGIQGNLVSFSPEIGPPLQRSRTSIAPELWDVTLVPQNVAQYQEFLAWFRDDIANGSLAFDFPHPATRITSEWRMMPSNPPFRVAPLDGTKYRISFQIIEVPS
ncbi:MAG: hypothetical protein AAFR68_04100 [Pseudomonadota bacterium]